MDEVMVKLQRDPEPENDVTEDNSEY